jgi:hypothetical protein
MTDTVASDSDRLLAEGAEVIFKDGTTARVVFDYVTLKRVEDDFGSIAMVGAVLGIGTRGKLLDNVLRILSAALEVPPDELIKKLDSKRVVEYLEACRYAFDEALPEPDPDAPKDDGASPNAQAAVSNGDNSTTSPQSDSAAPQSNSGA